MESLWGRLKAEFDKRNPLNLILFPHDPKLRRENNARRNALLKGMTEYERGLK